MRRMTRFEHHAIACFHIIMLTSLVGGCDFFTDTAPAEEEEQPPEEQVEAWVPPYSPCEENGFSCGEIDDDVISRSRDADRIVMEALESDPSPDDALAALSNVPDLNVTLSSGDTLMWWVDGGLPRFVSLNPYIPVADSFEPPVDDATLIDMIGSARDDSTSGTRTSELSAHGTREGFERNTKQALILSPYFGYGDYWKIETLAVRDLLLDSPHYGATGITVAINENAGVQAFQNLKNYDLIHVVSHGAQNMDTAVGNKNISGLFTSLNLNKRAPEANKTYTRDEFIKDIIGDCSRLDEVVKAIGDPTLTRGLACGMIAINYAEVPGKVLTPMIAVTSEYLANPRFNSAPLEDTFLNFSACSTAENISQSGFDLFMDEGSSVFAYTGVVSEAFASEIAIELYTKMLENEYDSELFFNKAELEGRVDPKVSGTFPTLWAKDFSSIRLNEVVFLQSDIGALEGLERPRINQRPQTKDGERYEYLDFDVELRGAHTEEDGRSLQDYQVGVFLADADGKPTGDVLEPGWLSPASVEGAELIDADKGRWVIPIEEVKFPMDLQDEETIQVAVQAKLGEGGISQTSYDIGIIDPNCPSATLTINGVPQSLVSNEVTVLGFGPVWNISFGRAEFDEEGTQTDRIHPSGQITIADTDLGTLGTEWTTLDLSQTEGRSGVIVNDDNTYYLTDDITLEDGSTFETNVTMSIRRLPNSQRLIGEVRGRAFSVVNEGTEVITDVGIGLDFITADINDGEPKTQCYFTR